MTTAPTSTDHSTPRLLVVGSYNASLTVFSDELPQRGQTVLGDQVDIGPGGKGNNQAISARRLGVDVAFVVKLGRDLFGDSARELFAREGLAPGSILEGKQGTGVALIMVDVAGDNMISVGPGANAELELVDVVELEPAFEGATHLLCQLECTAELFRDVGQWARERKMVTILNPAPAVPLSDETYGLIDLLTPNETELQILTGRNIDTDDAAIAAARELIERGVGSVVLTRGAKGVIHVTAETSQVHDAYRVNARDTTGAGDAFNGGLVAALTDGESMESAIDLGMRAAAFCVTRVGVIDGLATRAQLDAEVPRRSRD
ncbi:MAG: ribokinase [Acidimicrobiales bacterium]